jgi:hypothetical protein
VTTQERLDKLMDKFVSKYPNADCKKQQCTPSQSSQLFESTQNSKKREHIQKILEKYTVQGNRGDVNGSKKGDQMDLVDAVKSVDVMTSLPEPSAPALVELVNENIQLKTLLFQSMYNEVHCGFCR